MTKIVDIINLNADASCLSSARWLELLEGGKESFLYRHLELYVSLEKKVSLGITGATLADIFVNNRECIDLINGNEDIFEIIQRPFSHDIALLRSNQGFEFNLRAGLSAMTATFKNVANYYLAPEFMLTNAQIKILIDHGVEATFINAERYGSNKNRIPDQPYQLKGIHNARVGCVPIDGNLTKAYLKGIHYYNADKWNSILNKETGLPCYSWRDGESIYFIPDGIEREKAWLSNEANNIERCFLSELKLSFKDLGETGLQVYGYQPVHSFSAWMKEFRMINYVRHLNEIESKLSQLSPQQKYLWLYLINSDILSAVEKDSPIISLLDEVRNEIKYTIWRAEKNIEGDEILDVFLHFSDEEIIEYLMESKQPFVRKINNRIRFLNEKRVI